MLTPSGPDWCARFPTSRNVADLAEPFRGSVQRFLAALYAAGICVTIQTTVRPIERAYLMHHAAVIAGYRSKVGPWVQADPATMQDASAAALGIDWTHGSDLKAAVRAARAMCGAYMIVFPPSLTSRHIQGRAIDMSLAWTGKVWVQKADGATIGLTGPGRGAHPLLVAVGAGYGVVKLTSDPPHWSDDGH